jgi:hypothetical protein
MLAARNYVADMHRVQDVRVRIDDAGLAPAPQAAAS